MKLFEEHRASSYNETQEKALTKSKPFPHNFPIICVANPLVASSSFSTAKADSNKLPDSLLLVLDYLKGRYKVGPPIYLGDDPEPEDTIYDTTVNPLPPSPTKLIPGRIPRYERTQIQLPQSKKPASLASPKGADNQVSSVGSADSAPSSGPIEDGKEPPKPHSVEPDWNPKISSEGSLPQSRSSTEPGEINFMMLNARRLKEFLTENVDENATNLL